MVPKAGDGILGIKGKVDKEGEGEKTEVEMKVCRGVGRNSN